MKFKLVGSIYNVETIATGSSIREVVRLRRKYGHGRWRKRKGFADIKLENDTIHTVELHWYEAAGIGQKEFKIKRYLD